MVALEVEKKRERGRLVALLIKNTLTTWNYCDIMLTRE